MGTHTIYSLKLVLLSPAKKCDGAQGTVVSSNSSSDNQTNEKSKIYMKTK